MSIFSIVLLVIVVIAAFLIWIGNRAMNEPGQSPDVRAGGSIPILAGVALLVIVVIIQLFR